LRAMSAALTPIRNVIATVWTWLVLTFFIVLFTPVILVWRIVGWPFDPMNYFGGRLFRIAGLITVRLTPRWRFAVRGTIPSNPRLPYVVVANHESFADMLLLCHLPWEMKWLSKVEIMWIPILGWAMWGARDIGVKRGRSASAKLAMVACRKRLACHVSVIIFPEGTRAPTGEMLPFKDGAFRLAVETGVPVLPLAIHGTRSAIARRDWRISPAIAVVEVLEPEPSVGVNPQELNRRVRAKIETARDRLEHSNGKE
jgi:1-acyl-sn-glycerol-3-phosphate acyltransferase